MAAQPTNEPVIGSASALTPEDERKALSSQQHNYTQYIRNIVINHVIVEAERQGINELIMVYARQMLMLEYLKDCPMLLAHYGCAQTILVDLDYNTDVPPIPLSSEVDLSGKCWETQAVLRESHDAGDSMSQLVWRLSHFESHYTRDVRHRHGLTLALDWLQLMCLRLRPKAWAIHRAQIMNHYSSLMSSDVFGEVVRKPVKNVVLSLLDRMEAIVGKGIFVRPDNKLLLEQAQTPDVRAFIGVSNIDAFIDNLPSAKKEVVNSLRGKMREIEEQVICLDNWIKENAIKGTDLE